MSAAEFLDGLDAAYTDRLKSGGAYNHCALVATEALPKLTAALRAVEALTFASDDGSEWEHNPGCGGEPECPACWAMGIRAAITEALDAS